MDTVHLAPVRECGETILRWRWPGNGKTGHAFSRVFFETVRTVAMFESRTRDEVPPDVIKITRCANFNNKNLCSARNAQSCNGKLSPITNKCDAAEIDGSEHLPFART